MEMIKEPLHLTLERNRQMLAEREEQAQIKRLREGDEFGNRAERRRAARLARKSERA